MTITRISDNHSKTWYGDTLMSLRIFVKHRICQLFVNPCIQLLIRDQRNAPSCVIQHHKLILTNMIDYNHPLFQRIIALNITGNGNVIYERLS